MNLYAENGRKTPKYIQTKPRKNSRFGCPPIPPSTKMEADCFPVSENTENKPGSYSSGVKKYWVGRGMERYKKAGNMIFIYMWIFQEL